MLNVNKSINKECLWGDEEEPESINTVPMNRLVRFDPADWASPVACAQR